MSDTFLLDLGLSVRQACRKIVLVRIVADLDRDALLVNEERKVPPNQAAEKGFSAGGEVKQTYSHDSFTRLGVWYAFKRRLPIILIAFVAIFEATLMTFVRGKSLL